MTPTRAMSLATLVLLPALAGCPAAEDAEAGAAVDDAAVRAELEARWVDFGADLLGADPDAVLSHWTSDTRLVEPGMDLDRAELETFVRDFFAGGRVEAFEIRAVDVFVHGDVAYELGSYEETVRLEGQEPVIVRNNYFSRWEKEDGLWRLDRFVATPREAPEGA